MSDKITDEAFLHQYFHYYLHHMYQDEIANMFNDGFEAPLDPKYLCEAIHQLAERLGYRLVNNMWIDEAERVTL